MTIYTNQLREEARRVRDTIRAYGGSFMQAIGNALDYADETNLAKIRDTWNKEWNQYLEMARTIEGKEDDG